MTRLFDELKRRNVFRVAIAYVVAAWVIAQVADLVLENIGAPAWVIQALFFFMAVGFVVALIIAWAYEVTPEGIKRERDVDRSQSITRSTARRLDLVTIGLVAVALGLLVADRLLLERPGAGNADGAPIAADADESDDPGVAEAAAPERSIAVLPFVNMSADADQDYFADGIAEEILNALVKADGLRVAGRTSSFSFKGKGATIREIGEALGVEHVLEGSVRKQGNRVRITAQLTKADDGFNLWSETYDRSLDNIFDVQDDISRQVTQALRILLRLDDQGRLAATLTSNVEAYDLFLRGRDLVGKRIGDSLPEGIALLREALALDPEFAEAWATLAEAEAVSLGYIGGDPRATTERAQQYARTAIRLKPTLALPHGVIGLTQAGQRDPVAAIKSLRRASEMEPNNPLILRWLGNLYHGLGYREKALAQHRRAFEINPLSGTDAFNVAAVQFGLGNLDEAERMFRRTAALRSGLIAGDYLADIRYRQGDSDGAIREFMALHDQSASAASNPSDLWTRAEAETYARGVYGNDAAALEAARDLEHLVDTRGNDRWYWQIGMHIRLGRFERAFEILEARPHLFEGFITDLVWLPIPGMQAFREHPEFRTLLQHQGVVAAWQEFGWPDLCRPDPGTDGSDGRFSCS